MADHRGWPFWWLNAAMTTVSLIALIFGYPETMFDRVKVLASQGSPPSATQPASVETLPKAVEIHHKEQTSTNEKIALPGEGQTSISTERDDPWLGKGKPSRQQWKFSQQSDFGLRAVILDLWTPWKLFSFPIVLFASFVVSWSASNILILNLTQTQVFSAPPYNMSSQSVGKFGVLLFNDRSEVTSC